VAGIKDSSGDWSNTKAMLDALEGFEIFVGSEKFLLESLCAGGAGCITASANLNAAAIARLFRERSAALQEEVNAVRALLEGRALIAALKAVLAHFTGHGGWRRMRPPLLELPEREAQELIAALLSRGFRA
jgi:4-hydroxy-tetrahydrodipicolinate synthase